MGGFMGAVRGGMAGLNEASGNPQIAYDLEQRNALERQKKANQIQMQVAPLAQSLAADRQRLTTLTDEGGNPPKEGTAQREQWDQIVGNMAKTIGGIRNLMGDKTPAEDPSAMKERINWLQQKLHLGGKSEQQLAEEQTAKVNKYYGTSQKMAEQMGRAALPYAMTPEGQKLEMQQSAKYAAAKPTNIRLKDGTLTTWNPGQPWPDGATVASTSAGNTRSIGNLSITPQNAIQAMHVTGQKFMKPDGTPYSEDELRELSSDDILSAFSVGGNVYYGVANVRKHTFSAGGYVYAMDQFGQYDSESPIGLAPGSLQRGRESSTVDPLTGLVTTTKSTTEPQTPGARPLKEKTPSPTPSEPSLKERKPETNPTPVKAPPAGGGKTYRGLRHAQRTGATTSGYQLDASGHIPSGAGAPAVVTAANRLIDGAPAKDIQPSKLQGAAAELASRFGWSQGMWTPREKNQVQESRQIIEDIEKDPKMMSVFDSRTGVADPWRRNLIGRAIKASDKDYKGVGLATELKLLSSEERMFIELMRQFVGRIQGIAQLTRGSGRPIESSVNRMITEIPDIYLAQNKQEAQRAFDLIKNEMNIAMPEGQKKQGSPSSDKAVEDFLRNF